jgi:hypothetical protein
MAPVSGAGVDFDLVASSKWAVVTLIESAIRFLFIEQLLGYLKTGIKSA